MVNVDIDLRTTKAHAKIEKLRAQLATLDDIDADFSDMDFGEMVDGLEDVSDQLEDIRIQARGINNDLEDSFDLDVDEMRSPTATSDGGTHSGDSGTDPPIGDVDNKDGKTDPSRDFSETIRRCCGQLEKAAPSSGGATSRAADGGSDPPHESVSTRRFWTRLGNAVHRDEDLLDRTSLQDLGDKLGGGQLRAGAGARSGRSGAFTTPARLLTPSGKPGPDMGKRARQMERAASKVNTLNRRFGRLGSTLRRLRPTMRKWWSLLALIIPLVITLGVGLLGVASAMGAVAIAGAGILALGLGGHADSMGESFEQARQRIGDFAEDLFEVFQPSMQTMAPIQEEFFDFAAPELTGVADALEELTVYEDALFGMWSGLADWVEQAVRGMANAEETVTQLAFRFGELLGQGALDFFGFLLDYASQNQDMLIELGSAVLKIGRIILNVSEAFSRFILVLSPLLDVLLVFSQILNTPVVGALLSTIIVIGFLAAKVAALLVPILKLRLLFQLLGITMVGAAKMMAANVVAYFSAINTQIWTLIGSLSVLQKALLATGIGAVLVGGGMLLSHTADSFSRDGPPSGGGGGPTPSVPTSGQQSSTVNNYNTQINVQGDMDNASEQRIRDTIERVDQEDEAMSPPDPPTSESDS